MLRVSSVLAVASLLMSIAHAQALDFRVPGGDLKEALAAYVRQAGVQLLYREDDVRGLTTAGVSGTLSVEEALSRILAGTALTVQRESSGAIAIVRSPSARTISDHTIDPAAAETAPLRLAQADTTRAQDPARGSDAGVGPRENAAPERRASVIDEVLVTGTHIRGAENPTAPVIVMDREFIDATGVTTTIQLIESLPQNHALTNQSASGGTLSGNSFATIQGSTINLRAVGEGTTLTLVNGRRMPLSYDGSAVNIAALPLSAIERVEVLTDGASALYGSDAVGGVVNFVLRKDFEGAETRARYGHADGTDEHRLSQVVGGDWSSGNVVISAEHYARDMLLASDRNFGIDRTSSVASLLPKEENYAVSLFGRQALTTSLDAFLDIIYTDRNSVNRSFEFSPTSSAKLDVDNSQLSAAAGLGWKLGSDWRAELALNHGRDDLDVHIDDPLSTLQRFGRTPLLYRLNAIDLKADGSLFDLPGGTVRLAVGGHWRRESHEYELISINGAGVVTSNPTFDRTRRVGSLFTEASIPLIGAANAVPFFRRLDLSLAARYDEYSDFGSSVDPRVGLAWGPIDGLKLRASWGTSYLAPRLKDYDTAFNSATAVVSYPPAGGRTILQISGNAHETLKAQESENYTIGLDWTPEFLPGAALSINYYDIAYRDKIEQFPIPFATLFANPSGYGDVLIIDPTLEQVNEYISYGTPGRGFVAYNATFQPIIPASSFDRSSVDAIIDIRRRNIGVFKTRGFDLSATYDFAALGGNVRLMLDGAYIVELMKQVTKTSTPLDTVDTYANPTHLRVRAGVGYRVGGWSFNGFVHRRNSYRDNRFAPFTDIDAYTTVDANVGYRFSQQSGFFAGMSLTAGAINVLDEDPPNLRVRARGSYDMGFDPANASPLGRLLTLDLSKRW